MEINNNEFLQDHIHRYSVIAHEYFHTYQMTLNKHANKYDDHPTSFKTKWLIEGSAASFESIYIQQHYNENYFYQLKTKLIYRPHKPQPYLKATIVMGRILTTAHQYS